MRGDIIELMEAPPKLYSKRCKAVSVLLRMFLEYGISASILISWYIYDIFIAVMTMFLGFIIMGIIRSKLINAAIIPSQREFSRSDKEIAEWFTAKELCHGHF